MSVYSFPFLSVSFSFPFHFISVQFISFHSFFFYLIHVFISQRQYAVTLRYEDIESSRIEEILFDRAASIISYERMFDP
jgi:membrane-bound acyltransferase YfiQ involved in biofilm formation